eukprot:TRINITY_DN32197_c0_g2_i1.p1 TRINITY_DN32197_c0_g2~~TRINITY_DN32197_c0_g2_i1.p1  ORF type:complete len:821 (-),score=197.80 TRINITY_DN32197_c0_g2_i1:49-2511(-)
MEAEPGDGAYHEEPGSPTSTSSPGKKTKDAETTRLWRCLQDEKIKEALEWLRHSSAASEVNLKDTSFGWTPVHYAAHLGSAPLLKALAEQKAKLDMACREGNTPLMMASRRNHVAASELLISRKANLNKTNLNGWTSLIWCAINGCEDVAQLLIQAGVDYNTADLEGRTACMWAARHGHLGMVETLLANGLNLLQADEAGLTVLEHAQEQLEMRSLIAAVQEMYDQLQTAVRTNDLEGVRSAIEAGANLNLRDGDGFTPLMWAATHQSLDMVQLVVRHGANPTLLDQRGEVIEALCPDHLAVGDSVTEIFGANERLLDAAKGGRWDDIDMELRIGAWVNVRDDHRRTALMWAARWGAVEASTRLASKNADFDARDMSGWAAVHHAAQSKCVEALSNLHHLGADFSVRTYEGDSLLHIAVQYDDGAMVQLLLAAHADIEDLDLELRTPLQLSAAGGQAISMTTLLYYGADWKKVKEDGKGMTAFLLAVCLQQERTVAAMLDEIPEPPKLSGSGVGGKKKKDGGRPASREDASTPASKSSRAVTPKSNVANRKRAESEQREKRGEHPRALIDTAFARRTNIVKTKCNSIASYVAKQMDADSRSALALAVLGRNSNIIQMLLDEQADPESVDVNGDSVLNLAIMTNQREVVIQLMDMNVRVDKPNKAGQMPADLSDDETILRMLERRVVGMKLGLAPPSREAGDSPKASPEEVSPGALVGRGGPPKHRCRFEGLPTDLTEELLTEKVRLFIKQAGAPRAQSIEIAVDSITQRPRGHAYADFGDVAACEQVSASDGKKIDGRVIRAFFEIPLNYSPPPPPPPPE